MMELTKREFLINKYIPVRWGIRQRDPTESFQSKDFYHSRSRYRFKSITVQMDPIYICLLEKIENNLDMSCHFLVSYRFALAGYQWIYWLSKYCGYSIIRDIYPFMLHPFQSQAPIYYYKGCGGGHVGTRPKSFSLIESQLNSEILLSMSWVMYYLMERICLLLNISIESLIDMHILKFICEQMDLPCGRVLQDTDKTILEVLNYYPTKEEIEESLYGYLSHIIKTNVLFYDRLISLLEDKEKIDRQKILNYFNEFLRRSTDANRKG